MKIKVLALIMSLLLLCSCFVACNNGNDTEDTGTEAPATEAPGSDTSGEGEGNTPGEGEGNTPGEGEGNTPGEGEGNTPTQTPEEKYADLYAQGYVYYVLKTHAIVSDLNAKYILDQDNFKVTSRVGLGPVRLDRCLSGHGSGHVKSCSGRVSSSLIVVQVGFQVVSDRVGSVRVLIA